VSCMKLAALVAGAATLGGCLAGCGDRITATKTWSLETNPVFTTTSTPGDTLTVTGHVFQHDLGNYYGERCHIPAGQKGPARSQCIVFFNTGQRVYAAYGTGNLFGAGTFRSLDRNGSGGTLEVRNVGDVGDPSHPVDLIAHPG
jgi:hypothetical protein